MFNYKIYIMKLNKHHIKHICKVADLISHLDFAIVIVYHESSNCIVARPVCQFKFLKDTRFDIDAIVIDKINDMSFRPYTFRSYKNFNIASHLLFTLLK